LHLLIPLYKNEFGAYSDYSHLKKYLDYIIGECGHAIHQSCIESYIKTYGNMCPFDKLQWNPMKGDVPTYYVVENQ
jgi:hypothetical protein